MRSLSRISDYFLFSRLLLLIALITEISTMFANTYKLKNASSNLKLNLQKSKRILCKPRFLTNVDSLLVKKINLKQSYPLFCHFLIITRCFLAKQNFKIKNI